uniref:LIM zinc-binding domain-containing protein n=1 Tax=Ascaris lumbricoides TaxID=6252 RepID=A0A0M3IUY9_ASCLU
MNKICARPECGKTVYPLEELKCLDKVWHKQCFKCSVCGMTLSMKNYKGYNKLPYCEPLVWHKQCFKCSVCGMTLSMKNYKGYNKLPYCE